MFSVLGLLMIGLGAAALISHFGLIQQNITVGQGLILDDGSWNDDIVLTSTTTSVNNDVFVSAHNLRNEADVDAVVNLTMDCIGAGSCPEITTTYYNETNLRSGTLTLSRKNSSWDSVTPKDEVDIEYHTDSDGNFVWDNEADVKADYQGYILVYYKDEEFANDPERMGTPAKAYEINGSESFAIPFKNDGNTKSDVDYCAVDGNDHCKGAKLWLILETEYNEVENTLYWSGSWQSDTYFETDLLGWNDLDILSNPITIPAGKEMDFVIVTEFPVGTIPGVYNITTSVVPVA